MTMSLTIQSKVSIRLMSGGHSFSVAAVEELSKSGANEYVVEVATHKTTLVPITMFREESAQEYLSMVGLRPSHDEVVVFSPELDDRVAVMAVSKECYAHLSLVLGGAIAFVSPLQMGRVPKEGAIMELAGDTLFVRIFNGGMIFGEAIEVRNDADMLFALESIDQVYHIYNMRVRAKGDIERLKRCSKDLFSNLECE